MQTVLGQDVVATLIGFNFDLPTYGARIEVPATRAIASAWVPATLQSDAMTWKAVIESPVAAGDYNVVWMDEFGANQVTVPLFVAAAAITGSQWPSVDESDIRPEAQEVAKYEQTRLISAGGNDLGEFTADTRPTYDQVDDLIETSIKLVLVQLPTMAFDPRHYDVVRESIALQAAILVEGSYYREQLDQGSAELYSRMLQSNIISLNQQIVADAAIGSGRIDGTPVVRIA
jgi:hypothetical protein